MRFKKAIITILSAILPVSALAAGYLEFTNTGLPYKWDSPVTYTIDDGNLGGMTEVQADALVTQAFAAWAAIPDAALTFVNSGSDAVVDITSNNVNTYVNFNGTSCPIPDFVVVYDSNGQIFASLFGSAASGILGIASPSVLVNSTRKITCGYALINGDAVPNNLPTTQESVLYTLMHEFGHGQNLVHSQINEDLAEDSNAANDQYIPLMYPVIPTFLTNALAGGAGGIKLDDQFSIHYLYNSSVLNSEGRITGKVKDRQNQGVLGVNVVCYDKNNPEENVVSWISDAGLEGNGEYVCGHLPAGDYQVKIEPVTKAINNWDQGTPPFIPAEFFNGENESSKSDIDDRTEKTDITVATSTVSGIDFFINDDGKITSTKTVTGTIQPNSAADLEYFIYVPKGANKATFKLESSPSAADVDVYGKCDTPFSLALDTVGPIYNPTSPDSQQADFAGAGSDGNENVELDSSSSPEIDNCEYHLLLVNYDDSSEVTYQLTATLEGDTPQLKAAFNPKNEVQDNGETLVSEVIFEAQDDQFSISSIKFTDIGILSLGSVTAVTLYEDDNNNGRVDEADTILDTTSLDASNRTFTMSNLNVFIDEGRQTNLLITYTMPTTSSTPLWMGLALVGFALMFVFGRKNKSMLVVLIALIPLVQCSGDSEKDYNPIVQETTDLQAEASGFGEQFNLQVGKPSSVKDFFK